ncbi:MAG: hypothetical protein JWP75_1255 [Frondihabitans sp.]|nr:hypothetical protein [Frondihabitans sp.]
MLSDRGFFGPAQYEHFVLYLLLGLGLVALIVAWYVFVVRFSRTRLPHPAVVRGPSRAELRELKLKYTGLIDEVDAEFRAGRLTERAVHGRLSLLLRFFAYEASGVDAQVMTLTDLRAARIPRVAGAVEGYYPPAFQQQHPGDPAAAVATAREVVTTWS